jgi:hypothetical protein
VILETEASVIAGRVAMRGVDSDVPLAEQVLKFGNAEKVRMTFAWTVALLPALRFAW